MSVIDAVRRRASGDLVRVTAAIVASPFAFGVSQAGRPPREAGAYLRETGVAFLAMTVLTALAALIWPNRALWLAQSVVIGVALAALLAGNGVALALSRLAGRPVATDHLVTAALYGAGFCLAFVAAFKLVGLLGQALVPEYSGSMAEALTVFGGMGVALFGAVLLLEWPRRIAALDEGIYYLPVALLFLAVGVVLLMTGAA